MKAIRIAAVIAAAVAVAYAIDTLWNPTALSWLIGTFAVSLAGRILIDALAAMRTAGREPVPDKIEIAAEPVHVEWPVGPPMRIKGEPALVVASADAASREGVRAPGAEAQSSSVLA